MTGRGIAQAYGHAILPLCNERDVLTHVRWGILDFVHRFGRRPDGMWLPETAVNDFVLRVLAEEGIRFTILAPGQIDAVSLPAAASTAGATRTMPTAPSTSSSTTAVSPTISPSACRPARGSSTPPRDRRLGGRGNGRGAFGHHHDGADEVVARTLTVAEPTFGVRVPRLVDLLDESTRHRGAVRTSAWSCAHGVQRWVADCGCHTGGPEGEPGVARSSAPRLRALRDWGIEVFERAAGSSFAPRGWLATTTSGC